VPPAAEPRATDARPADGKAGDAPREERMAFLLQAGAFRTLDDAENMRGKLALLGYEARVVSADVNGQTLYRVRVGPYPKVDDVNQIRSRLAENGIEAAVVRQR
jgi:cell division protein FtsN